MKKTFLIAILAFTVVFWIGCNKDESEVDQLEQDVMNAENRDLLPDSSEMETETQPGEGYAMTDESMEYEEDMPSYEATESGGYSVQVGAGMDRARANYTAEIFIGRGYEPFITDVVINDTVFYRIRIGNFASIEEARILAADLKDKYSLNTWIDRNY